MGTGQIGRDGAEKLGDALDRSEVRLHSGSEQAFALGVLFRTQLSWGHNRRLLNISATNPMRKIGRTP
jgi:hypothetical protein